MSYRAFKRLLGETNLERKCRFLFGAFILLLITGSFWLYARQTEGLAYEQIPTVCRIEVGQFMEHHLATVCFGGKPEGRTAPTEQQKRLAETVRDLRGTWEDPNRWPIPFKQYSAPKIIKPYSTRQEDMPDHDTLERIKEFEADPQKRDDIRPLRSRGANEYIAAIRATRTCLGCHQQGRPDLAENDLLAVLKIEASTEPIAESFHTPRAFLISIALGTALLIMGGSYLIVRYVIVKPVKHLKEVSDAISAGELNVRSEIQTGDEFEDLSHAFNRMLRNLVSMQDRLRKVNADLDRKVDELAQANLALYESNRLKSDFLATMSHELRTPLNSILGFSEVLLESTGLSEKQTRWANNIKTSGEQLLALINDILDLAKIEAGKMQVRVTEFSARDACEGLLAMFRPLAEKKNIDLRGQFETDMPPVRQDMVKLQQIVSNLLSNAIKFTPEGGRVVLRVVALPGAGGNQVVITVNDTGVGIAPEEQGLIFEKFRQAGNPLTRQHAGTGLGLSIVRELSKLLGGEVTVQSELGRGSTFIVRLPLHLSEEPRLEFDLAHEGVDLSKAQRVDVRLYVGNAPVPTATPTRLDTDTNVETPALPEAPSGASGEPSVPETPATGERP
jgi:signal transduction histidine kinase